ncbi:MAG: mannitol dehydrogenase family protein [Steroidobacteraceae bacterium]
MRLSRLSATRLADSIERPGYSRGTPTHGILHFGMGAFHRAHQAVYTDDAIAATGEIWGITGVSLRSPAVAAQLNPQDGLYTVSFRSSTQARLRLIGSVRSVLVAPQDTSAVVAAIASAQTRIISFTVSEKGYCRAADDSLDLALAGEHSLYRYLRDGLALRVQAGLPGVTLLSCDNLASNGRQLAALFTQYLEATAPALTRWFHDHCTCPATMVDRIVPASSAADLEAQAALLGLRDEAAVFTEDFTQWVIEDSFAGPRPQWQAGGAQFTQHVHAYETAKLRMLNGAHSALAYLGLARGHEFVHEAIADPPLRALVERLMREEAATSFAAAPDQYPDRYADALLQRFANAALRHRLQQISMDGSQKIPPRWLATLSFHQHEGRSCPAILTALAAWIRFVRGDRWPVDDPRAAELAALWNDGNAATVVDALFGPQGMFRSSWVASSTHRGALVALVENPALL